MSYVTIHLASFYRWSLFIVTWRVSPLGMSHDGWPVLHQKLWCERLRTAGVHAVSLNPCCSSIAKVDVFPSLRAKQQENTVTSLGNSEESSLLLMEKLKRWRDSSALFELLLIIRTDLNSLPLIYCEIKIRKVVCFTSGLGLFWSLKAKGETSV